MEKKKLDKLVYITPGCFDKGGISRYSRYQINALKDILGGENVRVLSLLGPDENSFEEDFDVFWYGSKTVSISSRVRLILKLLFLIITWRPSIIHIAHVNFSGLIFIISKVFGIKTTILNVYGLEIWSGLRTLPRFGLKHVPVLISDCYSTLDHILENKMRSVEKVNKVIWDCVDLKKFNLFQIDKEELSEKYSIPFNDSFKVLTLGRLSKAALHKGYERLFSVFEKIAEANLNINLVVAGRGDYLDLFRQQIVEKGLSEYVHFTGSVDEEDMAAIYNFGDIFSLVSDKGNNRGEGIPLTPLEAMACGAPIIVGNHDGSQEAVHNESNGFVINPFDLEAHYRHIVELAGDRALFDRMATASRNVAESYFSYEHFVEKHNEILSSI